MVLRSLYLQSDVQVVESGRPIQDLQPGDSVLLPYGKASCRARPGCQPCSTGLGPSWAMASLTLLVPATLALDYGTLYS